MAASKIPIKKVCEFCGKEFIAYKVSTRYCSKSCNCKAYKLSVRFKLVTESEKQTHEAIQARPINDIAHKAYLSPREVAVITGITTRSVYNLIYKGVLRATKLTSRLTIIRRSDIEDMLDSSPYQKRHKKKRAPITELYTTAEVQETFNVSASWVFQVGKEENIPRVFQRGKTYWSKKHFDAFFAKKATDDSITEWYSVEDMKKKFNMTTSAVYCFVSKFAIPKRKVKREVFYSQKHVDAAKGLIKMEVEYYTVPEAMEKFGLTRDQLYHYVKRGNVPKKKEGKYTKIAKKELDELLAPPII